MLSMYDKIKLYDRVKFFIISPKGIRHVIDYGEVISEMGKYIRIQYQGTKTFECHKKNVLKILNKNSKENVLQITPGE